MTWPSHQASKKHWFVRTAFSIRLTSLLVIWQFYTRNHKGGYCELLSFLPSLLETPLDTLRERIKRTSLYLFEEIARVLVLVNEDSIKWRSLMQHSCILSQARRELKLSWQFRKRSWTTQICNKYSIIKLDIPMWICGALPAMRRLQEGIHSTHLGSSSSN